MNKVEFKAEDLKQYNKTDKSKIPSIGRISTISSESISNCEDLIRLLEYMIDSNNGFAKHEARKALNTIRSQLATIQVFNKHLQDLADQVEAKMTYMCGCRNCIETVKSIIRDDVKPFESQCIHCGQCEGRLEVSSE